MSNLFRVSRQKGKLSQEMAAKKLGIHVTTLNKYENDHRDPSAEVVRKMAKLYSCSVDELLNINTQTPDEKEEKMYQLKYEESQDKLINALEEISLLKDLLAKKGNSRVKKVG